MSHLNEVPDGYGIEYASVVLVTKGRLKGRIFDYDDDTDSGKTAILYCPNIVEGLRRGPFMVSKLWLREPTLDELLRRRDLLQSQWVRDEHARAVGRKTARSMDASVDSLLELLLVERTLSGRIHEAEMSAQFLAPSRVFVSYSSHDSWFVRLLNAELSKRDIRAWMFEWHLLPGQNIPAKISEALDASEIVLVVLSKAAINSMWVTQEWTAALTDSIRRGSLLIPVLLEDCDLPALLRPLNYADFRNGQFLEPLNKVLHSIRGKLKSSIEPHT